MAASDDPHCEFCGKLERKATGYDTKGLTILCPDEKWICDSCLKSKKINVTQF